MSTTYGDTFAIQWGFKSPSFAVVKSQLIGVVYYCSTLPSLYVEHAVALSARPREHPHVSPNRFGQAQPWSSPFFEGST